MGRPGYEASHSHITDYLMIKNFPGLLCSVSVASLLHMLFHQLTRVSLQKKSSVWGSYLVQPYCYMCKRFLICSRGHEVMKGSLSWQLHLHLVRTYLSQIGSYQVKLSRKRTFHHIAVSKDPPWLKYFDLARCCLVTCWLFLNVPGGVDWSNSQTWRRSPSRCSLWWVTHPVVSMSNKHFMFWEELNQLSVFPFESFKK